MHGFIFCVVKNVEGWISHDVAYIMFARLLFVCLYDHCIILYIISLYSPLGGNKEYYFYLFIYLFIYVMGRNGLDRNSNGPGYSTTREQPKGNIGLCISKASLSLDC